MSQAVATTPPRHARAAQRPAHAPSTRPPGDRPALAAAAPEGRFPALRRHSLALVITSAIAAVVVDALTPLGVSIGTLYVAPVLLALWGLRRPVVIWTTAACCALVALGVLISPPGDHFTRALFDRAISIAVVIVTAVLGLRVLDDRTRLADAVDRQRVLMRELDHRVRNTLANLLAVIDMTAGDHAGHAAPADIAERLRWRVRGMLSAYTHLSRTRWTSADLGGLVRDLVPPGYNHRVEIHGDTTVMNARQAHAFALAVAELLSNARRHGALAGDEGRVVVAWKIEPADDDARRAAVTWTEIGGPPPEPAPRAGLGLRILQGLVSHDLGGAVTLAWPPEGAAHRLEFNLDPAPGADHGA